MNTECNWLETRYEDLLSEDPAARQAIDAHAASCPACRRELESQRHLDGLLQACFASRMERARAGAATRRPALALAGAAAAVLALGLWLGLGAPATETGPVHVALDETLTNPEPEDLELHKPTDEPGIALAPVGSAPSDAAPEAGFSVMDQAGYAHTLADFGGRVLVLGVFGPETSAEDAGAFRELSDSLRSGDVRFLAVGVGGVPSGPFGSVPLMVNRGSYLLGLDAGDFAVITAGGAVFRTGSLSDAEFAEAVTSSLARLAAE
jgi:hypothetical protein